MIDRLTERQRAAQALGAAADLMTTTAALIEQGEDVEAECRLRVLREALNAADPAQGWERVAQAIAAATAPILVPGASIGQASVNPQPGEEHLSERDRLARGLNLPDSWTEAIEETRRAGPRTVEQWEADAQAREDRARADRKLN
ncbi:hypothetical protein [Deinococcus aestuarii]|uniref:hypothetical protein n=1 Tax=Deinococcus aestuarii TaxID=2774531 RepID=UPI001C0BA78B|nr:hypothetical protein [Deinococcus aestuarii]